jgi:hypothetical protein
MQGNWVSIVFLFSQVWANGILAFPYINVPFTPFARALKARTELLRWLQVRLLQRLYGSAV